MNTTPRTSNDGQFVRLANQAQEEANAALPGTFAFLKAFDPATGKSVNVRATTSLGLTPAPTPLTVNQVYTSDWLDLRGYATIGVLIRTDVTSIANGVDIQYSPDGATVVSHTFRTVTATDAAAGSKFFQVLLRARYVRLVYTNNGSTNQSIFGAYFEALASPLAATDTIEGTISPTSTATTVRNITSAKDPVGGLYDNITRGLTDGSGRTGRHVAVARHEVATPILALTSWKTGQGTVSSATVAVNLIPSPTTGRKSFLVKNLTISSRTVFIGPTSAVTSGSGYELGVGESVVIECDETAGVWMIGGTNAAQTLGFIEVIGT